MELQGKLILVVGLGESGWRWPAGWCGRAHACASPTAAAAPPQADALRAAVPAAVLFAGPFSAAAFAGVELIAISPGVPVQEPLVQDAVGAWRSAGLRDRTLCLGGAPPDSASALIAITGSNGKTTTTALVGALCRAAGRRTAVAGNIGPAALDALMSAIDGNDLPAVWVLELSSFQLETTHTLNADAATVLNISEDHLDRYTVWTTIARQQGAHLSGVRRDGPQSRRSAQPGGRTQRPRCVTFGLGPAQASDYGLVDGCSCAVSEKLIALKALQLVGRHNAANAMAALALCEAIGIDPQAVLPALAAFTGLPHRVEWVAEIKGVRYFDDSKGTNVGATLAAIEGLGCKVAIILGGDGKGQDFSPLRPALDRHARAIALIGRDAPLIAALLAGCQVPLRRCPTCPKPFAGVPRRRNAVTPFCSRRPVPAWTCIATTRIARKRLSTPFVASKGRLPDVEHFDAAPPAFRDRPGAPVEHLDPAADRHGDGLLGVDGDRRSGAQTGNQPAYYLVRHAVFLIIGYSPPLSLFRCR
jgi:UDP-N-acetylmuramoylalanine--D-glutamate ligase